MLMDKKKRESSPIFKDAKVLTCQKLLVSNGTSIAFGFPASPKGHKWNSSLRGDYATTKE